MCVCGGLLANQTMQQGEHLPPLNVSNISIRNLSGHQVGGIYLTVCHLIFLCDVHFHNLQHHQFSYKRTLGLRSGASGGRTWLRLNGYLKHLESSLIIDLGNEIHWSSLNLDLKSGTALSESHLSLSVEIQKSFGDDPSDFSWSCSTVSGQVLYVHMKY